MAKSRTEQQLEDLDRLRKKGTISDDEYEARRAAILSDTSQAAAPSGGKGRGIFKWGLFGCLGIFAAIGLLIIIGVVVIIAAVGSSADTNAKGKTGDVHVTLAPGATGDIAPEGNGSKLARVTILQIQDGSTSTNPFLQPKDGKKFIAFEVEVLNAGSKEITSLTWKLRDSKDLESDPTFLNDVGENLPVAYNLTPGGKQHGWVVFQVDADATVKWLRADPNPFLKQDLYFDAQ
jgi:hypothetical protein